MAHARKQIRDKVKALLDAVPAFAGRVSSTRRLPLEAAQMPQVSVYSAGEGGDESSTRMTLARAQMRVLTLIVDVYVNEVAALDDVLDGHAVLVETALMASPRLGNLTFDFDIVGTELGVVDENVTEPLGLVRLRFEARYRTAFGSPEALLD